MQRFDFVVIGAGPAGGAAALELARGMSSPSVALIGAEAHAPYERPPLSKEALKATLATGPQCLFGGLVGLVKHGVTTFMPASAVAIDRRMRTVHLSSGQTLSYGKLLFATGASARMLEVPGAGLTGVHYLRTYDDALALAPSLTHGRRLVVIGGGFIGLEVAATARQNGCQVSLIEAGSSLMGRAAPKELSARVHEKYVAEGVGIRLKTGVDRLLGDHTVTAVVLNNGEVLSADVVVVGIGAVPNDALAQSSGLEVANGIVVDSTGRTSDVDIYAAGDVASRIQEVPGHPKWLKRLEAWEPALEQGISAAQAMLGRPVGPSTPPWVWSNQFDWNLQFAGHGELADEIVSRPGATSDALTLFQLSNRRLVGIVTLNDPRSMSLGKRALLRNLPLEPAQLSDPNIPLKEALQSSVAAPAVTLS